MTPADVAERLFETGWLDDPDALDDLKQIVKTYQRWHGLKPDGDAGPITTRHLTLPRFCGHPDKMSVRGRPAKWRHLDVTYYVAAELPGMSLDETWKATDQAMQSWNRVSGLKLQRAGSFRDANIQLTVGAIDGPGGTLAWSNLPPTNPCGQKYDSRERGWRNLVNPGGYIDAVAVICHEVGHALGLVHSSRSGALMAPTYAPGRRTPQGDDDIPRIQRLYGKPTSVPDTNDPPSTGEEPQVKIELSIGGRKYSAAGTMKQQFTVIDEEKIKDEEFGNL